MNELFNEWPPERNLDLLDANKENQKKGNLNNWIKRRVRGRMVSIEQKERKRKLYNRKRKRKFRKDK